MIDLHMHSTYSDGSDSIENLIKRAKENNQSLISITDHDLYLDWSHLSDDTLKVISGMEISCFDYDIGKKVHLLVYGNRLTLEHTLPLISNTLNLRHQNSLRQLSLLEHHLHISLDNTQKSLTGIMYKQHIMQALMDLGVTNQLLGEDYNTWFKHGGVAEGDIQYPNVLDILDALKKDNVITVLAHPGLSQVFDQVPLYVTHGLLGIETYHGLATKDDIKRALSYSIIYDLLQTVGSDYHGHFGIEPMIGQVSVSDEIKKEISNQFIKFLKIFYAK
jgi:phosphoribosyl 1,2-cyclic phosphate 1,2-diphosphodiesterase